MRFTSSSWKKLLFVAISGFSLLPGSAAAEDSKGKFTLAKKVRWGTAVLPAGDYSYTVEHHSTGTVILRSLQGGPSAIVLATSVSLANSSSAPRLMLTQQGNDWFVTSMIVGNDGEQLYFMPSTSAVRETKRPTKVAMLSTTSNP